MTSDCCLHYCHAAFPGRRVLHIHDYLDGSAFGLLRVPADSSCFRDSRHCRYHFARSASLDSRPLLNAERKRRRPFLWSATFPHLC
nr:MAG TPA: hypothetical protein [Inoviridae sp.]